MDSSKKYLNPAILSSIDNMTLRAKLVVEGYLVGKHKSPYHGFSVEFAEHRTYGQGDEIKHIDWKLYGKTDRHYVKRFEEETNLRSYILLDTSKSMNYESKNITKLKYGESLAAGLTHLMIKQKDAVGLILFDNAIRKYISPKTSKSHKNIIFNSLSKCKAGENTNIQLILDSMAERIKKSGLVILISDLLDDPKNVMKGLNHFRHNKQEVIVFHLLDKQEFNFTFTERTKFSDMETGETITTDPWHIQSSYQDKIKLFINKFKRECGNQKIDYVPIFTDQNFDLALSEYIRKRHKSS
ncbi:MAG: DUF58 domain-containing protein [Candidatus Marinimicrobia bacterium]|nr:DUF58 domain-containing protein [Candidatus Neomarinimicrobiota bacterium]